MRTPAGSECPYFYGDYFRGRSLEECRLLQAAGERWTADLCRTCPVPGVSRANACEHLELNGKVSRNWVNLFQRRVEVNARCRKNERRVSEPHLGCGECHPLPPLFQVKK
jgi:hypothetical protein